VRWPLAHGLLAPADIALIGTDFHRRAQSVLAVDAKIGALQQTVAAIGAADNSKFVLSSDKAITWANLG
jgi:hypothetical protein